MMTDPASTIRREVNQLVELQIQTFKMCIRDSIWIEQSDVEAFWMSVCQQSLMQVRQSGRDRASVTTASHDQHTYFVLQQLQVDMMRFHGFIVPRVSAQIPEAFRWRRRETSLESGVGPPNLTRDQESRLDELSVGRRHSDE